MEDSKLLEIRLRDLEKLDEEARSQFRLALLSRFSLDLNRALRFAAREIRRLEEW